MRNSILKLLALAMFAVVLVPSYARAELSIAVVDIEKILSESKAAKSVQSQVDEKRKTFLSEVEAAEKKLRDEQVAIESKRETLSKEELTEKAKGFETSRMEARKKIQDTKAKLDQAYADAMNKLTKTIYEVSQKLADERKIDLIITRQNIIVGSMSLDVTKDVLEKLDAALPTLSLDVKK